nr:hypothetical protein [Tanacetum cinerariifolium]
DEETREQEEESFDQIPQTPEDSEDDGNNEEDQGLRIGEEERIREEEEADELYRDDTESGEGDVEETESDGESEEEETREEEEESFDLIPRTPEAIRMMAMARGLQVSQDIEDSHVTLTPVHPDGQQESSSVSSFVTSMLNPTSDAGVESIFTIASSPIAPLPTPTPIMTPSTIATITTLSDAPIPPTTIPSAVLQNLPTFDSVFRFEERVKSLEVNFSKFMPTNQFLEAISKISADLTDLELKKILIEKMEGNKDDDDQEGPSAGSDRGSKRQREGGEPESVSTPSELATRSASRSTTGTQSRQMAASETAFVEEPVQTTCQMDEPLHPVFETGAEDQPIVQTSQHPEWFSQPRKPPTPDRDWNKTLPAIQGNAQTWISELAKQADSRSPFNELLNTPIDFSNFIMNRLCIDTLTHELLEVYKATTNQLDWVNPEGQQYPHNLLQPLSLIPDNRGRRVIPFAHFINNDLEYLRGGASSRKCTTFVTKTKVPDYGHIKWIEDLVPCTMWIQEPLNYDKHAFWGVSHWGRKHQQFYGFAVNRESSLDVYSKRRIIVFTDFKIVEWHNYKHLDWILVHRDDDKIYKFKEGDFKRLRL